MRRLLCGLVLLAAVPVCAQPVTYAWRLDCENDLHFGPFGTPDACTAERGRIGQTCREPTVVRDGKTVANPIFLPIADVCRDSLNGRLCGCAYVAYPAIPVVEQPRSGCSVLDLLHCDAGGRYGGVCTPDDRLRCARWLQEPATP